MSEVVVLDELNFDDLEPIELPTLIEGGKYILREASGKAANTYQNFQTNGMTLSDSGKPKTVSGLADSEPLLVSMCLFNADLDDHGEFQKDDNGRFKKGKLVPLSVITFWPVRVQSGLHDKLTEISGLKVAGDTKEGLEKEQADLAQRLQTLEEKAAKNDSSPPQTMHG